MRTLFSLFAFPLFSFCLVAQPWRPVQVNSDDSIYKITNFFRANTNLWTPYIPWAGIPAGTISTGMVDSTAYSVFTAGDGGGGTTYTFTNTDAAAGVFTTNGSVVGVGTNLTGYMTTSQVAAVSYPVINVRMPPWNAVGNGVADDSVPIQAALNHAAYSNGTTVATTVFIPEGDYYLSNSIIIPTNTYYRWINTTGKRAITVQGQGGATRLLWYQTDGNAFQHLQPVEDLTGAFANTNNKLGQVHNLKFKDFAVHGPVRWSINHPAGQTFDYSFASNVTAQAFAVGNTTVSNATVVSSVAVRWLWENVFITGFKIGIALTNGDYCEIKQPSIESFTYAGVLFAGCTEPRISGGAIGTVGVLGSTWTNDLAGIVFTNDVHTFPNYNAIVDNVEGGYQSRLVYAHGVTRLRVNECAADTLWVALLDVHASTKLFVFNSWCANGPFLRTPNSSSGSGFGFPWTFINCSTDEGRPFIINDGDAPALDGFPQIIDSNYQQETFAYNPYGDPANRTIIKTNFMMQCNGTNFYYLPRVGQAVREVTETLTESAYQLFGAGVTNYTNPYSFGFTGGAGSPVRQLRAWGTTNGLSGGGIKLWFPLGGRFQESDVVTLRVPLGATSDWVTQTGGSVNWQAHIFSIVSNGVQRARSTSGTMNLVTPVGMTNIYARIDCNSGAEPVRNWDVHQRYAYVVLFTTNDIIIGNVAASFNQVSTPPTVSSGWRLPDGP
jgi:hypothetical protein